MGLLWPLFYRISAELYNLSLYGKIRVRKNLYSRIFYAVFQTDFCWSENLMYLYSYMFIQWQQEHLQGYQKMLNKKKLYATFLFKKTTLSAGPAYKL